jgi:hypothetical protein
MNAAQIVDQVFCRFVGEVDTGRHGRPSDGLPGRRRFQKIDPVPRVEIVGEEREVRVELGDEILSHRKQRPTTSVCQCLAEIADESLLLLPVGWIKGENLFELVEDEAGVAIREFFAEPAKVFVQTDRSELGGIEVFFGGSGLLERGEDAEAIAIGPSTFHGWRRFVANPDGWEYLELEFPELGVEAGLDQ